MNRMLNKILRSLHKVWGYFMLIPNMIICKYKNPKTLIILGMHRSGTSCITRIFNLCNVYLGPSLLSPQDDNPKGFWENSHVFEINEKILKQSGGSWENPPTNLKVSLFDKLAMISIIYNRRGRVLGIKDPRMILTWSAWEPFIKNYCIIGIFRHPLSVAKSLEKRNNFDINDGLELWKEYNKNLINIIENKKITLIDFDNSDQFKNKIINILSSLDLNLNEKALNFYDPEARNSDNINNIQNEEIFKIYNTLINY